MNCWEMQLLLIITIREKCLWNFYLIFCQESILHYLFIYFATHSLHITIFFVDLEPSFLYIFNCSRSRTKKKRCSISFASSWNVFEFSVHNIGLPTKPFLKRIYSWQSEIYACDIINMEWMHTIVGVYLCVKFIAYNKNKTLFIIRDMTMEINSEKWRKMKTIRGEYIYRCIYILINRLYVYIYVYLLTFTLWIIISNCFISMYSFFVALIILFSLLFSFVCFVVTITILHM